MEQYQSILEEEVHTIAYETGAVKRHGKLDAKLCAMVIQQSFIQEGCWLDPLRSLVKAADSLRREGHRIMVAFYDGNLEKTVQSILRTLRSGCCERRSAYPSTAQLLLEGLDWQIELLLT